MSDLDSKLQVIKDWLGTGSINFFGRQFSGKDVQAARLARYLDAPVIGGGEIIRNESAPAHVRDAVANGNLAPTDEYKKIIVPYFSKPEFSGRPLLLSAVGRMHGEESTIIEAAKESEHTLKAVVHLDISEEEAARRMKISPSRDRADDTEDRLKKRLGFFRQHTLSVLDTYEAMGLLVRVDAMPPEDVVFDEIVDAIYKFSQRQA